MNQVIDRDEAMMKITGAVPGAAPAVSVTVASADVTTWEISAANVAWLPSRLGGASASVSQRKSASHFRSTISEQRKDSFGQNDSGPSRGERRGYTEQPSLP
jgi:hypothetical protein